MPTARNDVRFEVGEKSTDAVPGFARSAPTRATGDAQHRQGRPTIPFNSCSNKGRGYLKRPIILEAATHSARPGVAANIFCEIIRQHGAGALAIFVIEPAEIGRFTPRCQSFRKIRRTMEEVMPTRAPLAAPGGAAVTCKHRIDQGKLLDPIPGEECCGESYGSAPVVTDQRKLVHSMRIQQLDHITGNGAVVISGSRTRAVPQSPHVWRDHPIFR